MQFELVTTMDDPRHPFDRPLLLARLRRAALGLPDADFLLRRCAEDIAERLSIVRRTFTLGADIGSRHGVLASTLSHLPNVATVVSLDPCADLLGRAPMPRVLADEEALPFADASLDLVVSALSLHLVNDLPGTLAQIRRALKPDGLLLASLLGGSTLTELRQSWLAAESEIEGGASPRVAPFLDVRQAGALLQRAGFALPVVDAETVTATYPSPLALMRDLRAMGAANMLRGRRRSTLRRETLARAVAVYEQRFAGPDGRIPATFEIITMTAWAPDASQPQPLRPGSATTRLADALGASEPPPDRTGD